MSTGRPTLLTPDLQAEALKLAQAGVPKSVIADAIGIARSTLNYWLRLGSDNYKPTPTDKKPPTDLEPYRQFSDAFARARANAIVMCEAIWMKAIRDGDASQASHWLKVHHPDLYKDTADVNVVFGDRQAAMDAWKQSIIDMDRKATGDDDDSGG